MVKRYIGEYSMFRVEGNIGFNWIIHKGEWVICGPKSAKTGQSVFVKRRDGTSSMHRIGKKLKQGYGDEGSLYECTPIVNPHEPAKEKFKLP